MNNLRANLVQGLKEIGDPRRWSPVELDRIAVLTRSDSLLDLANLLVEAKRRFVLR